MENHGYWQFPFSNYPLVSQFFNEILHNKSFNRPIKIFFLVEGTFVMSGCDDNTISQYPISPLDPNYRFRLISEHELKLCDVIVGYNEIDVRHFESLPVSHPYRDFLKKFVYVPYLPVGIFDRSNLSLSTNNRDIDVLTLFTNGSITCPTRHQRRLFFEKLHKTSFFSVNLSNVSDPSEMASFFSRSKVIIHVSQSLFHRNHSEISLLPALSYGVIVMSEKCAIHTQFKYSKFIIWSDYDSIIDTIQNVLSNYESYFTKIQKDPDLANTLIEMKNQASSEFKNILQKI
jgi:hypothetical protein